MNVTQDSNRNGSPSRANQYEEAVVRGVVESFSSTLFALLHSQEAMEAMTSNIHGSPTKHHQEIVGSIVAQAFQDAKTRNDFRGRDLVQFEKLRDRVFRTWNSLMKGART